MSKKRIVTMLLIKGIYWAAIFSLATVISLPLSTGTAVASSIIQLTNNTYDDVLPQIDAGEVVWSGYDGSNWGIFVYDGTTTTKLIAHHDDLGNPNLDRPAPQIDAGQVVWAGLDGINLDWYIFFYDGTTTTQLTNTDCGDRPQIDAGQVVWQGIYGGNEAEIFLYDGTTTTQLTNDTHANMDPQIDAGQVVWMRDVGEIFLYDGTTTTQLTNTGRINQSPQIDAGQVVWSGEDYNNTHQVFLYDGTTTTQLTNSYWHRNDIQIDAGEVVWSGYDGSNSQIFLYDGTSITQLTNNTYDNVLPQIDAGQVVWRSYDGNDYEIFLYDGTTTTQLTNNTYDDGVPQIDAGEVVWSGYDGNDYEIFLYSPLASPPNTPVGTNVPVPLPCGMVTFSGVAAEGYTTCTTQQGNPVGGIPSGFRVRGLFIDITTTAAYSGAVTVCIPYDHSIPNPQNLKLFHWNAPNWEDVTTSIDPATNTICGQVSGLSPFFVGEEVAQTGEGCFIATAAYGSYLDRHVQTLRDFRDSYMVTNPVGRSLVSAYYKLSPPIAEFIDDHPSLKPIVRVGLLPAVAMSTVAVDTTPVEKIAIALVILTLLFVMRERKGQRKAT